MSTSSADAFILAHMQGASPERVAAVREFLSGYRDGRKLTSQEEWRDALAALSANAPVAAGDEADELPPRALADEDRFEAIPGLPAADTAAELAILRSWVGVGTRIGGQVFFGADA